MLDRRGRRLEMKESATFIASAAITIFLTGCIIIAHDVSNDFRQSLVALTGHHWMSVSVIVMVLFALSSGLLLGSKSARKILRAYDVGLWSTALIAVTLIMILGILAVLICSISSGLRFIHRIKSGVKKFNCCGFLFRKIIFWVADQKETMG